MTCYKFSRLYQAFLWIVKYSIVYKYNRMGVMEFTMYMMGVPGYNLFLVFLIHWFCINKRITLVSILLQPVVSYIFVFTERFNWQKFGSKLGRDNVGRRYRRIRHVSVRYNSKVELVSHSSPAISNPTSGVIYYGVTWDISLVILLVSP